MKLRTRIILGYILLVAGSFSLILYLILNEVRPRYLEAVEESTVDTAELLAALLAQDISAGRLDLENLDAAMSSLADRVFSAKIFQAEKQKVDLRVYITDNQGRLLYDSAGQGRPGDDFSNWRDVNLTLQGRYGARSTRLDPEDPTSSVLYIAAPILKDGQLFGVVTVGKPKNSVSFFIAIARKKFFQTLLLVGGTAIILGIVFSAWITWPIYKLIDYVNAIRQGAPKRLPLLGHSEIGELGAALDEMQTQLEGKNYIEDYVRALTHEMKSPLTGIKGAEEILRDHVADAQGIKFLNNIDAETRRLQSLVERMLQLSRLENVKTIAKTRISAPALFQELARIFQTQLTAKNLRLLIQAPQSMTIEGDELLLRQALGNLIANALDFSPAGGQITLTALEKRGRLGISIADQGPGIPDFALPKVFDKFFSLNRPGSGKKSTGLGLPFVREVISLHGGEIGLNNLSPGLEVRITLPF